MEEAKTNNQTLAISHGSLTSEIDCASITPAEALKLSVEMSPENEFVGIQIDKSPFIQTYDHIWEVAKRRLGGLRSLNLQPGNFIIFQVSTGQDFTPTLWACIMGGFVPVPVPLAFRAGVTITTTTRRC